MLEFWHLIWSPEVGDYDVGRFLTMWSTWVFVAMAVVAGAIVIDLRKYLV